MTTETTVDLVSLARDMGLDDQVALEEARRYIRKLQKRTDLSDRRLIMIEMSAFYAGYLAAQGISYSGIIS